MRLKKWTQAWKIRLIQEKNPSVDHYDAQWIPAFVGMTKKDQSPRSHGARHSRKTLPVIPAKAGIRKDAPWIGLLEVFWAVFCFILLWKFALQGNKAYFTKNLQI